MTKNNSRDAYSDQLIGQIIHKDKSAPTIVFFGGIHGNEPSGVKALEKLVADLNGMQLDGSVYAVYGNKWALEKGVRFQHQDLNRIWTHDRIEALAAQNWQPTNQDEREQLKIWHVVTHVLTTHTGPIYFIDLHTTSSKTKPFVVMNDSLLNRAFTKHFPLPIILGVEEYLDGPLLSYINELGYVAFGFEAGQHDDPISTDIHHAFAMVSLSVAGLLANPKTSEAHMSVLTDHGKGLDRFYEIFYRHRIETEDVFEMQPGFVNFQIVEKGKMLATSNGVPIKADRDARVFMPLYQSQGSEGFFAIRAVPHVFLRISRWVRKLKVDRLLPILPGVRWSDADRTSLLVNKHVARFMAKQIFHLLGYRSRSLDRDYFTLKNRETASRIGDYESTTWWNNAKRSS